MLKLIALRGMIDSSSIVVNARFLTQPVTGVQQYAIEISCELKKLLPQVRFVVPPTEVNRPHVCDWELEVIGKRSGSSWEQWDLPRFLKKCGKPLLVNLCNAAPLRYENQCVTIHDVAFERHPEWFSTTFQRWYRYLIPRIVHGARHVFTISEFSQRELYDVYGIKDSDVTIVSNGIARTWQEVKPTTTTRKNYLLTVGSQNPRKNMHTLLQAMSLLPKDESWELYVVGGKSHHFANQNTPADLPNVTWLGYVSDAKLARLYQEAKGFVYPSLYEGFGLPILEALYFNCPVLASDIPVFRECFGRYITYFDPLSPDALATTIRETDYRKNSGTSPNEKLLAQFDYRQSAEKLAAKLEELLMN